MTQFLNRHILISRRKSLGLLAGLGAGTSLLGVPSFSFAQGTSDRKFIFVILRGGMDGLAALIPDDKDIKGLRGHILPAPETRLNLGNGFRLHPSFAGLRHLYAAGEAAFIHAAATPYRDRSHFEGQDRLETLGVSGAKDGWLNRTLYAQGTTGLAVGRAVPLAMKGVAPVKNWSPPIFETASSDLLERLSELYVGDPLLSTSLAAAKDTQSMTMELSKRDARRFTKEYTIALSSIGRLMSEDGGPGIGMVALDGWDTHDGQANDLAENFAALDEALVSLKVSLGQSWQKSCVVLCSEFGRTAAANGTNGTDHGTGGLVMLLGGAVKGGKLYGDWPGVKKSALYEKRDLFPANDVAAILKGVLRDHLGVSRTALNTKIFPNSGHAFEGLIG